MNTPSGRVRARPSPAAGPMAKKGSLPRPGPDCRTQARARMPHRPLLQFPTPFRTAEAFSPVSLPKTAAPAIRSDDTPSPATIGLKTTRGPPRQAPRNPRSTPRFPRVRPGGPGCPATRRNSARSAPRPATAPPLSAPYLTCGSCDARLDVAPPLTDVLGAAPGRAGQSASWVERRFDPREHRRRLARRNQPPQRLGDRPAGVPRWRRGSARRSRSASGLQNSSSANSSACCSSSHGWLSAASRIRLRGPAARCARPRTIELVGRRGSSGAERVRAAPPRGTGSLAPRPLAPRTRPRRSRPRRGASPDSARERRRSRACRSWR